MILICPVILPMSFPSFISTEAHVTSLFYKLLDR